MKLWVQCWLMTMLVTAILQLAWLPSFPSTATTICIAGVFLTNVPLLLYLQGFSRLHGVTHLPFLMAYFACMGFWFAGGIGPIPDFADATAGEQGIGVLCVTIYGICFLFDIHDAYMYLVEG